MSKAKCFICKRKTDGIGHYTFTYLNDKFDLCGHHAQKVRDYIKEVKRENENNN